MANKPADFTPSLDGYSGQRPFRFWCQKVLPLVYDDSLSYYELLNKVVHYLNNAISDVATVEENVQGLHDAYVKLQEYVNNYFSTLDVQEEIDNKLDTMAQDGSLSALISPLLPAIIAQWMEDNITPTTPVVDKSLSIEGAAADAQVVGVNMTYPKPASPYAVDGVIDLNNILEQGHYVLDASLTVNNAPDGFRPTGLIVERFRNDDSNSFVRQTAIAVASLNFVKQYVRHSNVSGEWTNWYEYIDSTYITYPKPTSPYVVEGVIDLNNILEQGHYVLSLDDTLANAPEDFRPTALIVERFRNDDSNSFVRQTAIAIASSKFDKQYVRHSNVNGVWTNWTPLGESVTNVINKNVTENTYNNTYNITTNPHFTTDENGWLNAIDNESTDESSATDMTGAILSLLTDTGYCHLGPGTFYVSGGIELPSGAMIEGCGNNTIVRLLSGNDNYIFRPVRYSIIKNLRLSGGKEFTPIADIGGRNGIYFYDNKTDFGDSGSVDTQPCIIDSVYFDHFSGAGIYGHGTGGGTAEIIMVSNCVMEQCTCGINLEFFTEYCKFISVVTRSCYYGCINNGGNNVFVGCTFHGTTGFVIDNTADDKINLAHGSCNGCTFNHIGSNTGYSIKIDNCNTTFLFEGCNWWYGTIHIGASSGIIFNGCEGGGNTNTIEVSNSSNILFANMMLNVTPTLSIVSSNNVRFKDVLNYKTGEYIGE